MGRIPEDTIREIRDRADIVGLIGRYVELKKAGRNYKGLCPFHGEKTPSFNVNPDKQIFHCFGCEAGGDVIGFLIRHDGLTFPEAVANLAGELGIEIPETGGSERGVSGEIFAANEAAQRLYRESLMSQEGAQARAYLEQRGLDADAIERFGIGFAPDRWDAVVGALQSAKIPATIGEQAGLIAQRRSGRGHYDRLRGRVTFPIQDVRGRTLGFGGRAMSSEQDPKYLNTPESPVFQKRRALYGMPMALEGIRRAGRSIVCEGYFDSIALARAGMGEAVATCGTALTREHAANLGRRSQNVVLLFDGDAAGKKAVERALEILLPEGLRVKVAVLPAGEDPDSYLLAHGAPALREVVDRGGDAVEFVLQSSLSSGWSDPAEKADVVGRLAPLIASIPNRIERDEYVRRLALATDSELPSVQAVVRGESRRADPAEADVVSPAVRRELPAEERHLRDLASLLYRHPDLAQRTSWKQLDEIVPDGAWKAILRLLVDDDASHFDSDGGLDLNAMEAALDSDAQTRLRELAVLELEAEPEMSPDAIYEQLIQSFAKRRLDARMKELTRRMREPGADAEALLREKQRLNEEARAMRAVP